MSFEQISGTPGSIPPQTSMERAQNLDGQGIRPLLLEYWTIVQRRKIVIGAAIVAALVMGVIVTLLMPSIYSARILIQIDRDQKRITNVEGIDPESASRDAEFYATQYELLQARSLAERIVRKLNLANDDVFFAAHGVERPGSATGDSGRAKPVPARASYDSAISLLLQNIVIEPVRNSRLVNVTYNSRNASTSAAVANAWGTEFIASNLDRQYASTAEARQFLEQRLAVLKERLEQSERDAVSYANTADIVKLDGGVGSDGRTQASQTIVEADLSALNAELTRAVTARIIAQSNLTGLGSGKNDASLNSPEISALRQRRGTLVTDYSKLLVQFEPEYSAAKSVKEQIDTIDRLINNESNRALRARQDEFKIAQDRETELRRQVSNLKQQLQTQQSSTIQFNIFQRDADTNRQLYEAILQRYKEIGVAGTVGVNNIAIVDAAQIPESPSSPNIFINMGVAFLAGLGLAAAGALILEQLDQGLRDPNQIKDLLSLPLVGTVPLKDDAFEQDLTDPKSEVYEAYFASASNLSLATASGFPRSMMLTSTQPGEGKSSSSIVFSIILGRLGKRVLIIDADLRSPSLQKRFEVEGELGLSNVLTGSDSWKDYIQQTRYQNVSVLSAGPIPPNAPVLLSGPRLENLVSDALTEYDHVIVDAPPILGLADAPLISKAVEGTLFIIEAKRAPVQVIREAINRLRTIRSPLIGGMLTKLSAADTRYANGSYGYGYGYGYGHDYGKSKNNKNAKKQKMIA